jgi:hypothetical protein
VGEAVIVTAEGSRILRMLAGWSDPDIPMHHRHVHHGAGDVFWVEIRELGEAYRIGTES